MRPSTRLTNDRPTGDDPNDRAITLKGICAELKIDPRVAREKLRTAIREPKKYPNLAKAHKPRQPMAERLTRREGRADGAQRLI